MTSSSSSNYDVYSQYAVVFIEVVGSAGNALILYALVSYVPQRLGLCWSRVPGMLYRSAQLRHQWTTNVEQSASRS